MFRQYENPWDLQDRLARLKEEYEQAKLEGRNVEALYDLYLEIEDVKDRIRFAWEDMEFDENY